MIFNLFKSKPTLKELIPNGFVDIHSHVLPGIDDGAKNLNESLNLISEMRKLGFSKIIGTPHTYEGVHNNTNETIKKSFVKLKNNIHKSINLSYASEYMTDSSLIKKAKEKTLMCLKDNYVLVEMSYLAAPINIFDIIFELKVNGYIPIMAHPERYIFLHNKLEQYFKLKKVGCLFQLNLLSATTFYGVQTAKITDKLLKYDLIDFVGSDIHNQRHINGFENKVVIKQINKIHKAISKNKFFED